MNDEGLSGVETDVAVDELPLISGSGRPVRRGSTRHRRSRRLSSSWPQASSRLTASSNSQLGLHRHRPDRHLRDPGATRVSDRRWLGSAGAARLRPDALPDAAALRAACDLRRRRCSRWGSALRWRRRRIFVRTRSGPAGSRLCPLCCSIGTARSRFPGVTGRSTSLSSAPRALTDLSQTALYERFVGGVPFRRLALVLITVYAFDALLTPIAMLAASDGGYSFLALLPFTGVLYLLGQERRGRLSAQNEAMRLDKLAHVDELTRVANRRSFERRLAMEQARARRAGHGLSVLSARPRSVQALQRHAWASRR